MFFCKQRIQYLIVMYASSYPSPYVYPLLNSLNTAVPFAPLILPVPVPISTPIKISDYNCLGIDALGTRATSNPLIACPFETRDLFHHSPSIGCRVLNNPMGTMYRPSIMNPLCDPVSFLIDGKNENQQIRPIEQNMDIIQKSTTGGIISDFNEEAFNKAPKFENLDHVRVYTKEERREKVLRFFIKRRIRKAKVPVSGKFKVRSINAKLKQRDSKGRFKKEIAS